jgi:hypothetical protein
MAEFRVLTPLNHNGRHYRPGELIELSPADAYALPPGVLSDPWVNPVLGAVDPAPPLLNEPLPVDPAPDALRVGPADRPRRGKG